MRLVRGRACAPPPVGACANGDNISFIKHVRHSAKALRASLEQRDQMSIAARNKLQVR